MQVYGGGCGYRNHKRVSGAGLDLRMWKERAFQCGFDEYCAPVRNDEDEYWNVTAFQSRHDHYDQTSSWKTS